MARIGMHFSLWASAWTEEAAEAALPEAARHGVQLIEIPLFAPETIDTDHAKRLLDDHGIAASGSICLPEDKMAQEDPAAAQAFLMPVVEAAARLGCTFLGGVTYSALGYRSGRPPTEREYDNIALALRPVARAAAGHGITLGIEPCNRYETHLLNTGEQAVALIERIGEPNLAIHFDTYHMNIEEKGGAEGLRAGAQWATYLHVSESDRGVPGTGSVQWDNVFRTLAEIGFDGDLVAESFVAVPPSLAAALCVWRPVAPGREEVLSQGLPFIRAAARRHGLKV